MLLDRAMSHVTWPMSDDSIGYAIASVYMCILWKYINNIHLTTYMFLFRLKLSPNLRKRPKKSKKDPTPLPVNPQQEKEKMTNLISIVSDAKLE